VFDIDKYIDWIQETVSKVKEVSGSLSKPDISYDEVRRISTQRVFIASSLISEANRVRALKTHYDTKFRIWWSKKFSDIRKELNPSSLPGTKFSSKSDIEAETISRYEEEYLEYQERLSDLENQYSFYRDLVDTWKSIQGDISSIIKTFELEAFSLGNPEEASSEIKRRRSRA
jgi:hypothetical protein